MKTWILNQMRIKSNLMNKSKSIEIKVVMMRKTHKVTKKETLINFTRKNGSRIGKKRVRTMKNQISQ